MKGMKSIWLFVALIVAMAIVGCGKSSNANSQSIVEKPLVKTELAKIADRSGVMGYIDKTGRIVITDIHTINGVEEVMSFSKVDGTAAVLKKKDPSSKNRVWMFIDKEGKNILEPSIESLKTLHSFSCERALFNDGTLFGYFDKKGKVVIPANFGGAKDFGENGLAPVKLSRENFRTTTGSSWGYIDVNGNVKIPAQFASADIFSHGLAAVTYQDKGTHKLMAGCINENGEIVFKSDKYTIVGQFAPNGLAPVKIANKGGYINRKGEIVITGFDRIKGFAENGLAAASYIDKKAMSPKWGFIDSQGKWYIKPIYDDAGFFSVNGLAPVKIGDFWGYIDTTGNMVIEPQFRAAYEFVVFQ